MTLVRFKATLMSARPGLKHDIRHLLKFANGYVQRTDAETTYVEVEIPDNLSSDLYDALFSLRGVPRVSFSVQEISRRLYTGFAILPSAVTEPTDRVSSGTEYSRPTTRQSDSSFISALQDSAIETFRTNVERHSAAINLDPLWKELKSRSLVQDNLKLLYVRYDGFRTGLDGRPRMCEFDLEEANLCHASRHEIIQHLLTRTEYMQQPETFDTKTQWSWYDEDEEYWTNTLRDTHHYSLIKEDP